VIGTALEMGNINIIKSTFNSDVVVIQNVNTVEALNILIDQNQILGTSIFFLSNVQRIETNQLVIS
jgi:hypothetical protein